MFVSLTRLHIASRRFYPLAFLQSLRMASDAARTPRFRTGRLLRAERRTLRTITGWDDDAAMKVYRNAGLHLALMPTLMLWCDEAAIAHWTEGDNEPLLDWLDAHRRLQDSGRPSKVKHPTADQLAFLIAPLGKVTRTNELPLDIFARRRAVI
jgi:hypothetical protein